MLCAGRMLRSGIVQRTVDLSESSSSSVEQTWLMVHCADKAGLLAEIAQLITAHAHNIKVRGPPPVRSGTQSRSASRCCSTTAAYIHTFAWPADIASSCRRFF